MNGLVFSGCADFSQVAGTFYCTKERYRFLEKVYEYNTNQTKEHKFTFVGIDIEHQDLTALRYLATLIDTTTAPSAISDNLKKLIRLKNNGWNDSVVLSQTVNSIQASLSTYRSIYKQYLGNNYLYFEIVIGNMINKQNAYSPNADANNFNRVRDSSIFETFL